MYPLKKKKVFSICMKKILTKIPTGEVELKKKQILYLLCACEKILSCPMQRDCQFPPCF